MLCFFLRKESSGWANTCSPHSLPLISSFTLLGRYLEQDFIWSNDYLLCDSQLQSCETDFQGHIDPCGSPVKFIISDAEQYFLDKMIALHRSSWKSGQEVSGMILSHSVLTDRWQALLNIMNSPCMSKPRGAPLHPLFPSSPTRSSHATQNQKTW